MKVLLRIIFIISSTWIGLVLMANIAGRFLVSKSDGLAGGAMVLGYGLLGAGICLVATLIISLKLSHTRLRWAAIGSGAIAVIFIIMTLLHIRKIHNAGLDPESAYAGLPAFTVAIQQTKIVDPYLTTRHTINTHDREWANTLPNGKVCRGNLSAQAQRNIARALIDVSQNAEPIIKSCQSTKVHADKELSWKFSTYSEGMVEGTIAVSQQCREQHPPIAHLIREVSKAHLSTRTKIKCK